MKRLLLSTALALFCTPVNAQLAYSERDAHEIGKLIGTYMCEGVLAGITSSEGLAEFTKERFFQLPFAQVAFASRLGDDPALRKYEVWFDKGLEEVVRTTPGCLDE